MSTAESIRWTQRKIRQKRDRKKIPTVERDKAKELVGLGGRKQVRYGQLQAQLRESFRTTAAQGSLTVNSE